MLQRLFPFAPSLLLLAAICLPAHAKPRPHADPDMKFYTLTQDAQGLTADDLDEQFLQTLQAYTLEQLQSASKPPASKGRKQAKSAPRPKLSAQSRYLDYRGSKLAVVQVQGPGSASQVFVHGLEGKEFRRLVCYKASPGAIGLEKGACAERMRTVFATKAKRR